MENSVNPYLTQAKVSQALSQIQGSHQKAAFDMAKVTLQSQAAYEMAEKGPIRPSGSSTGVIYNMKCIDFKHPMMELEVTCVNETEVFLSGLVAEIGYKLKTSAVCHRMRCIRYGVFDLEEALLEKHCDLENVLNAIYRVKMILDQNNTLKENVANFMEFKRNERLQKKMVMEAEAAKLDEFGENDY